MAESAQITSVEAIESFRSKLIEFISQMRPALGEVGSEVLRTRVWLHDEHRRHWENELRLRSRRLEEAKLLVLKKWSRELENRTAPLMKQVDQLYGFLAADMVRGVAHLDEILKALEAYRNVKPTNRDAPTNASPGGTDAAGTEPPAPEPAKTEDGI